MRKIEGSVGGSVGLTQRLVASISELARECNFPNTPLPAVAVVFSSAGGYLKSLTTTVFLVLIFVAACAGKKKPADSLNSPELNEEKSRQAPFLPTSLHHEFTFAAMGTVWLLRTPNELDFSMREKLAMLALTYDLTFSDWTEESELRKLEQRGLEKWQRASPLFIEGLKYSLEAFKLSDGSFDITVGAVLWKSLAKAVGMSGLKVEGPPRYRFRFARDPKRLSFGGIVKGMCAAELAYILFQSGIRNFEVNAGGGNLVLQKGSAVVFISRSKSTQKGVAHIIDPKEVSRNLRDDPVELRCQYQLPNPTPSNQREFWTRAGALNDAFTKALLISTKFSKSTKQESLCLRIL